ncbi:MAG: hypothetical protein ABJC13_23800 [Acidobacteriota bacterium]
MADRLIVVTDSGVVYKVTLGGAGKIEKLKAGDRTAVAAREKAASGAVVGKITRETEERARTAGAVAAIIMGTLVNLPEL